MKRFLLAIAAAVLSLTFLNAEETTKVYEFGEITRIEVGFLYDVHITEGKSGNVKVVYESDYEKHLRVKYRESDSKLLLELNDIPKKFKRGEQPHINVYIEMDRIDAVTLTGAGKAFFDGKFTSGDLRIEMSGASGLSGLDVRGEYLYMSCSGATKAGITGKFGNGMRLEMSGAAKGKLSISTPELNGELSGACSLTFEGDIDDCELECSGASRLELNGNGKRLDLEGSGACRLDTRNFTADNVGIELSGASRAEVYAEKTLRYDISTVSKMTYYGNAELVNINNDNVVKGN